MLEASSLSRKKPSTNNSSSKSKQEAPLLFSTSLIPLFISLFLELQTRQATSGSRQGAATTWARFPTAPSFPLFDCSCNWTCKQPGEVNKWTSAQNRNKQVMWASVCENYSMEHTLSKIRFFFLLRCASCSNFLLNLKLRNLWRPIQFDHLRKQRCRILCHVVSSATSFQLHSKFHTILTWLSLKSVCFLK